MTVNGLTEGLDAAGENTLLRNEIQSLNQEISQLYTKLKNNEKGSTLSSVTRRVREISEVTQVE
jgi:hypothetical protein